MPIDTCGYGVSQLNGPFCQLRFKRRDLDDHDVHLKILYCGICHSDVKVVGCNWDSKTHFPCIPGHEIVGQVVAKGARVTKFNINDFAAVGVYVDTCGTCHGCSLKKESYCSNAVLTYDSPVKNCEEYTKGGYSQDIVVHENYSFSIPQSLHNSLARVAPLLCAGITVYSPLIKYAGKNRPGVKVGVVGLGGLGHMAVKFAKAFSHSVTVISSSLGKKKAALEELKADNFLCTNSTDEMLKAINSLDVIIDTASCAKDIRQYINLLNVGGTYVLVGLPEAEYTMAIKPVDIMMSQRSLVGSITGSLCEIQEMLEFCGKCNVLADIELIKINQVTEAFKALKNNKQVKYRFVIDIGQSQFS